MLKYLYNFKRRGEKQPIIISIGGKGGYLAHCKPCNKNTYDKGHNRQN
jgi:hypothetical protein